MMSSARYDLNGLSRLYEIGEVAAIVITVELPIRQAHFERAIKLCAKSPNVDGIVVTPAPREIGPVVLEMGDDTED